MSQTELKVRPEKLKSLIVGEKEFKSAYDSQLTLKEIDKARDELGEEPEKIKICLKELKEKISGDSSTSYCTDDVYLLRFLRIRKYDVQRAFNTLREYCSLRRKNPKLFDIPKDIESLVDLDVCRFLPYTDEEGRIIFWIDIGQWNPSEHSFPEIAAMMSAVSDVVVANPKSQVNGIVGIWDANGLSVGHFTEFMRENGLKTIFSGMQHGYPWRIKKLVVINTGRLLRLMYSIFRPFFTKKIKERMILLGSDLSDLHQHVNPAILPKKLGGSLDEKECKVTQHLMDNLDYLRYEGSYV